MHGYVTTFKASAALLIVGGLIGCGEEKDYKSVDPNPPKVTEDEHAHPSEGPHHGSLIELGNEEYHAELVHDDAAGTVTVYVLDSAAAKAVPIDAQEITINVTQDGAPKAFTLAASPEASEGEGKSSRFTSSDKDLAAALDAEGTNPRLSLKIADKSYSGDIVHDHDHDHDHAH